MNSNIIFAFLTVSIIFNNCWAVAQNLQLSLKSGETYYHNSSSTMTTSVDYFEEAIETTITFGGKMSFKVEEDLGELYKLKAQFQSLHVSLQSNEMNLFANSAKVDSSDIFSLVINQMTKSTFDFLIDKTGNVIEIEMDQMIDNIFNPFPEIPKLERARFNYLLKQSFGETAMKGNIEMITAIYPKTEVQVDESWNNEIKLKAEIDATVLNTFKLIEYNSEYAIIDGVSTTISNEGNSFVKKDGELTKITVNGTIKSSFKIDSKTGWILESTTIQDLTGLTEKKRNENSTIILKMPFTITGKTTVYSK